MSRRLWCTVLVTGAVLVTVVCGLVVGTPGPQPARAQTAAPGPNSILRTFAVGGVLTADGTLWQYLPDKQRWFTIDEAFRAQGKETRILPLPVKPEEIADLATWGFLLTRSGTCWLYDIEGSKWVELPPPTTSR